MRSAKTPNETRENVHRPSETDRLEEMAVRVTDVLDQARVLGASACEAAVSASLGLSVTVRQGQVDTLQRHADRGLTVTVFFGHSKGSASSGDWNPGALDVTVRAACDIARKAAADPFAGLPDATELERAPRDLRLDHPWELGPDEAIERARRCEQAALESHAEIANSDGATLTSQRGLRMLANSHGFLAGYPATRHSIACTVIGERGGAMQRGTWYSLARSAESLQAEEAVGRLAAERARDRLDARRIDTRLAPVLFAPEAARGLVSHFVAAASGGNLYRRASFLVDRLGEAIFPEFVRLAEEPHLPSGLGSAPFDAEGVITRERNIVAGGVLQSYVLNSYSTPLVTRAACTICRWSRDVWTTGASWSR